VFLLFALVACSRMSALTPEALRSAEERWAASKVDAYKLVIEMEGDRVEKEQFEVVVRDGAVVSLKRNGQDVPKVADQDYSMNGLYKMLHQEMSLAEKPAILGAPEGYTAYLMARFDEGTGRLEQYRRTVGGTSNTINITVRSFEPEIKVEAKP
jgi:hypothetical protein